LGNQELGVINDLNVFPNPADKEIHLAFSVTDQQNAYVQVIDVTGKILQQHQIQAVPGSNLVLLNTQGLSSGSYLVRLKVDSGQRTIPVVVKQ
jgi:hypothetical protein